jgi:hypothetical protein
VGVELSGAVERLERFEQRQGGDLGEGVRTSSYLKARLKHRPKKIIDVRLNRVELDNGDAALDIEINAFHARKLPKRFL